MEVRRYVYGMTDVDVPDRYIERAAVETTMWGSLRLAPIIYAITQCKKQRI